MSQSPLKAVLLENVHRIADEVFQSENIEVQHVPGALNEGDLSVLLQDVHILGIRSKTKITPQILDMAPKLLALGCFCIGTNQVDIGTAKNRGCPVFNAPYSNTRSVAELIIAEIIMLSRQAAYRSQRMHQGHWEKSSKSCYEVRGKTLGIVGYGHIGSQLGILAEDMGMRVLYYDIVAKMPIGNCAPTQDLQDLLKHSDFVSIHVPETARTKGMIGSKEMGQMKAGSYLLNASRGSVVDLEALAELIKSGHIAGAAVDVFPEEPESNAAEFKTVLQGLPNVILTPHIGGNTEEAQKNIGSEVATSLVRFVRNGSSSTAVNFPNVNLPVQKDCHRILNVHKNVPGILAEINNIISNLGANIEGQYLATDPEIGYLIVDLDKAVSDEVKDRIKALKDSIKTRILY